MTFSGFDVTRPAVARVYDALASGRDNYATDRDEAERLLEICPQLRGAVRKNRGLPRARRHLGSPARRSVPLVAVTAAAEEQSTAR